MVPIRRELVYVDNAATTKRPSRVIDSVCDFYRSYNSNIQHGMYDFAIRATEAYELARSRIAKYFNVSDGEVTFTNGNGWHEYASCVEILIGV
jgi:cysteine desulfurase/selenocysteine lyase